MLREKLPLITTNEKQNRNKQLLEKKREDLFYLPQTKQTSIFDAVTLEKQRLSKILNQNNKLIDLYN